MHFSAATQLKYKQSSLSTDKFTHQLACSKMIVKYAEGIALVAGSKLE